MNACHNKIASGLVALLLAASPGTGRTEPASPARQRFQEIASRLDLGGELFTVIDLTNRLKSLFEEFAGGAPARDHAARERRETAARVDAFLRENGAYGLQGIGFSAMARPDGRHTIKCFIRRDYVESSLPLWRGTTGWLPRRMMALDFLPGDADYARATTADPIAAWNLMRTGMTQAAAPPMRAAFEARVEALKQRAGLPLDDILVTLRDETFLVVRLREDGPELLLGVSVRNDLLRGVLEAQLAEAGLTLTEIRIGETPMRYTTEPLPGDWPIHPALATQSGFLLCGSSTNIVADAVHAFRHKSGLISRPGFRALASGLPLVNNGLIYMGPRMGDAVAQDHAQRLAARFGGTPDALPATIRRRLAALGPGHSHAFVLLNWRQGVMLMGNSSWGAEDLLGWLTAGPQHAVLPLLLPEAGLIQALLPAE